MSKKLTKSDIRKRKKHHEKRADYYDRKLKEKEKEEKVTGFRVPWKDNRKTR